MTISDGCPMAESARFLALEDEALRLANEAEAMTLTTLEDCDAHFEFLKQAAKLLLAR